MASRPGPSGGARSASLASPSRSPPRGWRSPTSIPPWWAFGRAVVAACLAAALLAIRRAPPRPRRWPRLALVAVGVVVGFPIFTSLALRHLSSAHASVIVGVLPAATAAMAVMRAASGRVARSGSRPPPA